MRLCALLSLILVAMSSTTQAGWKAAVSRADITPEQPLWMSGYAARDHAATGQQTPLWAKALVLEDEQGRRGVIISLDLCGIDRETSLQIRNRLIENHDLTLADIAENSCCRGQGDGLGGDGELVHLTASASAPGPV